MGKVKELQIRKEQDGRLSLWCIYDDGVENLHKILHEVEARGLVNTNQAVDTTGEIPYIRVGEPRFSGVALTQK